MSRCIPLKDTCNLHPTTPGSESIPKFATGFERHVATGTVVYRRVARPAGAALKARASEYTQYLC